MLQSYSSAWTVVALELSWLEPRGDPASLEGPEESSVVRRACVGWAGESASLAGNTVEVPARFAECLSLPEGELVSCSLGGGCGLPWLMDGPPGLRFPLLVAVQVLVRPVTDISLAISVTLEPLSEDDWEIVVGGDGVVAGTVGSSRAMPARLADICLLGIHRQELNASCLEEQLLNQICIVFEGEVFPFWIGNQVVVKLKLGRFLRDHFVDSVVGSCLPVRVMFLSPPTFLSAVPSVDLAQDDLLRAVSS